LTRHRDNSNKGLIPWAGWNHTKKYIQQKQKQITSKTTANCPTLFTETLSILICQDIIFKESMEKN
jgi:hypothetical protein